MLVRPARMVADTERVVGRHHVTHRNADLTVRVRGRRMIMADIFPLINDAEYPPPDLTELHPTNHGRSPLCR
jgi:hypothetical protein